MAANRFDGLDAALRRMKGLAPKLAKGALRRTGTKAMKPVRDAARATARSFDDPESASNIPKKIVTKSYGYTPARGGFVTKVGVQGGARPKKGREDEGHWRFLEFGTSDTPAQPFMRPALENNEDLVIRTYVSALGPEIDKAMR